MRLLKIFGQQFGPFKDYYEWEPALGVTGIIGEYEDVPGKSNGCGKTQLITTMLFALYGEGQYKVIVDVINDSAKDDANTNTDCTLHMRSGVEFMIGSNIYKVERGYKAGKSYLIIFENSNEYGDVNTTIAKKENKIKEIIGMDYLMFSTVSFAEQRKIDKLMSGEFGKTQDYLYKALNIDLVQFVVSEAVKNSNKVKDSYEKLCEDLECKEMDLQSAIDALNTNKKDHAKINIEDLKNKETNINAEISELISSQTLLAQIDEIKAEWTQAQNELTNIHNGLVQYRLDLQDNQRECETLLERLDILKSELKDKQKQLVEVIRNKDILKYEMDELHNKCSTAALATNTERTALAIANTQLTEFKKNPENSLCLKCHQIITKDHIDAEVVSLSAKIAECESRFDQALQIENDLKKVHSARDAAFQKQVESFITVNNDVASLSNDIKNVEHDIEKVQLEKININSKIDLAKSKNAEASSKFDEVSIRYNKVKDTDKSFNTRLLSIKKEELRICRSDIESYYTSQGAIQQKEKDIEAKNNFIKVLKDNVTLEKIKCSMASTQVSLFKQMLNDIFDGSIELINYYANEFFNQVEPDYTIRLRKDTTKKNEPIVIDFLHGNLKRDYLRFSEGQKVVVNIALRIGLAMAIMSKADRKINFICLDEPFESLDTHNRELVKSALIKLSNIFEQIILISHTPDIYDCNQIVKVIMDSSKNSSLKIL